MRIGFNSSYLRFSYNQNHIQNALYDTQKQLSSGKKIQFGYESSTTFIETLRLDYEETTLKQSISVSEKAKKFSDNTDTVLSQLSSTMDNFKQKLIQSANQMHSEVSLQALANDMEAMKDHFKSLANTSVGGEYLFSGSAVTTPPINADNSYGGNNEKLQGLVASSNLLTYNITGQELFYGRDSDYKKRVTTNIKNLNQTHLHPEIMHTTEKTKEPKEVYITSNDTIRDLIGDNDDDPTNDGKEYFYMQGRRSDGTFFKTKFAIDKSYYNEKSAAKVSDLLTKIGIEFGNNTQNNVVDVRLNEWGQIEITDLKSGSSSIDFHLVSADQDVEDIDDLLENGANIKEYVKSNYYTLKTLDSAKSENDLYDHRVHRLQTTLKIDDNSIATYNTDLESIFGDKVQTLRLSGNAVSGDGENPGAVVAPIDIPVAGKTVRDVVNSIKENFSTKGAPNYEDINVEFINGKFIITDKSVKNLEKDVFDPPYDGPSFFSLELETLDGAAQPVNGISNDYTVEFSRVRLEKNGSKLLANNSQIVRADDSYAIPSTKLSEVSGQSIDGQTYVMDIRDVNGQDYKINLNLSNSGSTYNITDANGNRYPPAGEEFQIYAAKSPISAVKADDITYKQFMDVIKVGLNFTNLNPANLPGTTLDQNGKDNYESSLDASKNYVEVNLDRRGKLEIQDKRIAYTKAEFSIYEKNSDKYPPNGETQEQGMISFHSNNALTIDDPHVDFFSALDTAIESVRNNIYRPDGFNTAEDFDHDVRNIGIQNSIALIDHMADHINKLHTKNGAQGNSLQYALEKNELLSVQVQSLRSTVIDTDIAYSAMRMSQLTMSYQAALQTISKVNTLSLVNYI